MMEEIEKLYWTKRRENGGVTLWFGNARRNIHQNEGEIETLYSRKQMGNRVITFHKKTNGKINDFNKDSGK